MINFIFMEAVCESEKDNDIHRRYNILYQAYTISFYKERLCTDRKRCENVLVSFRRYHKAIAKNPDLYSPITYTFRSDGVIIESNVGKTETKWDAYTELGQLDGLLYIMRKDNKIVVVNQDRVL